MGFFRSLSTGWRFIKEAFRMAFADRRLLKPSIYMVLLSVLYWIAWVVALVVVDFDWEANEALGYALCVIATFGSFLMFFFFSGMTVNMVDVHIEGGEPSMKDAFADAKQNFWAIMWMAIISTIVNMLARAIRGDGDNIIGNIIAGIIESIWTIMTYLMLPAIIIEDCSMREALKRVRQYHKDNVLLIGIGDVGVRFITGLIAFFVIILISFTVFFAISGIGGTAGVVVGITAGGTMLAMLFAFTNFVRMAYYTCLYLWAKDVATNGQEAPAPLPLARALGHNVPGAVINNK